MTPGEPLLSTQEGQFTSPCHDSYKLIALEDDSFDPEEINYVPTIKPKNTTNTTNSTNTTIEITTDNNSTDWDDNDEVETTYDEYEED